MKKFIKLLLSLMMVFSLMTAINTTDTYAATYYTEDVAAEARKHVGQTYAYGGTGPSVFDCSGFVYYCYKVFGVNLSTSTSMYQNGAFKNYGGTQIPISSLQPGDVICFGPNGSKITHVGIYVGNGLMVNAANNKYNVCYMYISMDLYYKYGGAVTGNVWNASTGNVPLYGVRFLPLKGSSSTTSPSTPVYNPQPNYLTGKLDSVTVTGNSINVVGWAYDGDHVDCRIYMDVYLDDEKLGSGLTDVLRTDVNSAYNLYNKHGFNLTFSTGQTGTHTLKVYAMDFDSDDGVLIGSKSITIGTTTTPTAPIVYNPQPGYLTGKLESATVTGSTIAVKGWAYDGDHIDCRIFMDVYLDDEKIGSGLTDTLREDINTTHGLINKHGFDLSFTTDLIGKHTLKVYAMDFDSDDGVLVGSETVALGLTTVAPAPTNKTPTGHMDSASVSGTTISASGWAYDPDVLDKELTLNVYFGDELIGTTTTSTLRTDVNQAYGTTGNHGYSFKMTTKKYGTYTLNIMAVDANTGKEQCVGTKELTVANPNVASATIKSYSLVLSGQMGMNFFVEMNDIAKAKDGYMNFTINGKTSTIAKNKATVNASGQYVFTCPVSSIQLGDTITASYYCDGSVASTKSYSVKQYIDFVLNNSSSFDVETMELVKAISDYGYYAQQFFSTSRGWAYGVDHVAMNKYHDVSGNVDLSKYKPVNVTTSLPIKLYSYSLLLDSETTLKVYLSKNGYTGTPQFSVDGKNVTATYDSNTDCYVIAIPNISAHLLGHMYSIAVNGTKVTSVCALSYANSVISNSSDTNLKNLMKALNNYYVATMNYKNK